MTKGAASVQILTFSISKPLHFTIHKGDPPKLKFDKFFSRAKRYERLMKAHNLHQPRETNKRARSKSPKRNLTPPATPSPPKRRRKTTTTNPAKPSTKKAITPPIQTRDSDDDDEEFPPLESVMPANIKPERRSSFAHVKPEPAAATTTIKQEEEEEEEETQPDKPVGGDAIVQNPIIIITDPTVTHVEPSASQSTEERSSDVEQAGVGEFEKRWIELRGEGDGLVVLE